MAGASGFDRIGRWADRIERNLHLVVRQSCQDVTREMTRRQASSAETGGFQVGKVPVDTGELVNSQSAGIGGGTGGGDFASVAAGVRAGDVFTAVYTAPHAPFMEYGTSRNGGGRFFVRSAARKWQDIVLGNAARLL